MSKALKWRITIYMVLAAIFLPINYIYNKQLFVELYMRYVIRNENIILTFTTTPTRIKQIKITVQTILEQSRKPQAIYINIPYKFARTGEEYVIPDWLLQEKRITILRTNDYGPATKLLGLLEQIKLSPETIVITVDDDVFYPDNLVVQLAYQAHKNSNAALSVSGVELQYDIHGEVDTSSYMGLIQRYNQDQRLVPILQGYAGIAYRAGFFADDIFAIQNSPPGCIASDDLYFSFYLAVKNHPRKVLYNNYISAYHIAWVNHIGTSEDALHRQQPSPSFKHKECLAYLKNQHPETIF